MANLVVLLIASTARLSLSLFLSFSLLISLILSFSLSLCSLWTMELRRDVNLSVLFTSPLLSFISLAVPRFRYLFCISSSPFFSSNLVSWFFSFLSLSLCHFLFQEFLFPWNRLASLLLARENKSRDKGSFKIVLPKADVLDSANFTDIGSRFNVRAMDRQISRFFAIRWTRRMVFFSKYDLQRGL